MRRFIPVSVFALACLANTAASAAMVAPAVVPGIPSEQDAPIALLVDLSSGQTLFAREPDRRFMPASITKVMTTYVAIERLSAGKLFQRQITAPRAETFRRWRRVGSTMYLAADASVTIDDLLHGVTTVSANDGAAVLAEAAMGSTAAWIAEMNATARRLGMRDSHFGTPNGWMDEGVTFTTARDLVTLGSALVTRYPAYYRHFVGAPSLVYNGIEQRNHDPITGVVAGADGIKTGFTNQAGFGFLGSAERNGRRLMMVVAGSPNGRTRNDAARALMEWGFASYRSQLMFPVTARLGEARVQGGGLRSVPLVPQRPIRIATPLGQSARIALRISYDGPVKAPISQGDHIAELAVFFDGRQVSTLPLVAEASVSSATPLQRVFNGIAGLLPWA